MPTHLARAETVTRARALVMVSLGNSYSPQISGENRINCVLKTMLEAFSHDPPEEILV
jgi:hypothetical protein